MKNIITFLFISIISSAALISQDHSGIEQTLHDLVASKKVTGLAAAYSVDGNLEWSKGAGLACKDDESSFSPQTLTRTASIAKPMTAIAIMQLFEKGQLDLDATLDTYISDLSHDKGSVITVRHLLEQTSGIGAYASGKEAETKEQYNSLEEALTIFKDRDLLFEPGSDFKYSTYGYVVLGRVIEEVSGMSYGAYVKQNIWDVAGMENTGVEEFGKVYENKSGLFHRNKKKAKRAKQNNLSNRIPAGGIYSTVEDLLKFGNAIINHQLISEESLKLMSVSSGMKKEGNPYGMGWYLYGGSETPGAIIGHSGEQTGCSSQLMIVSSLKTVIVVLSNTSGSWNEIIQYSVEFIPIAKEIYTSKK